MLYINHVEGFYCLSLLDCSILMNVITSFKKLADDPSINLLNLQLMLIKTLIIHSNNTERNFYDYLNDNKIDCIAII